MAYAHCHECNWGQDDFWDEGYNPLKFLADNYQEMLLDFDKLDDPSAAKTDSGFPDLPKTHRGIIVQRLKHAAQNIEEMKILTYEEAVGAPCPKCGEGRICID